MFTLVPNSTLTQTKAIINLQCLPAIHLRRYPSDERRCSIDIVMNETPEFKEEKRKNGTCFGIFLNSANHLLNQVPDLIEKDEVMEDEQVSDSRETGYRRIIPAI